MGSRAQDTLKLREHIGTILLAVLASLYLIHGISLVRAGNRATYFSHIRIRSKRAAADFDVDADLKKQVWKHAQWLEFDHDASGRRRYRHLATRVASAWTESYVYFAFSCRFNTLNVY